MENWFSRTCFDVFICLCVEWKVDLLLVTCCMLYVVCLVEKYSDQLEIEGKMNWQEEPRFVHVKHWDFEKVFVELVRNKYM